MPENPAGPSPLARGVDQFNRGEYFEAHEEWEKTWYGSEGPENRFLKGLIQVAVSLYHLETGNLRGARKVMKTALEYLSEFSSPRSGVDIEGLRRQILPLFQELEKGNDPFPLMEGNPPRLRLDH